jgi:hypothetical protein
MLERQKRSRGCGRRHSGFVRESFHLLHGGYMTAMPYDPRVDTPGAKFEKSGSEVGGTPGHARDRDEESERIEAEKHARHEEGSEPEGDEDGRAHP